MPRIARFVAPGVAHHITQRGTARQLVFRTRTDRLVYLDLLREQAAFTNVRILAYQERIHRTSPVPIQQLDELLPGNWKPIEVWSPQADAGLLEHGFTGRIRWFRLKGILSVGARLSRLPTGPL